MKKNMHRNDGIIRLLIAAIISILFFTNIISGAFGLALLLVAGIFIITSFVHICPIYMMFGMSTCKVEPKQTGGESGA